MTVHIQVPYETSGQELGETREAMTRGLMKKIENIINSKPFRGESYYICVHAKPNWQNPREIRQVIMIMAQKPPMMLSCMLFGVNPEEGKLTLEWALPGDWPTWSVGGKNEPVPETIASINKAGIRYHYDDLLPS